MILRIFSRNFLESESVCCFSKGWGLQAGKGFCFGDKNGDYEKIEESSSGNNVTTYHTENNKVLVYRTSWESSCLIWSLFFLTRTVLLFQPGKEGRICLTPKPMEFSLTLKSLISARTHLPLVNRWGTIATVIMHLLIRVDVLILTSMSVIVV